MIKNLLLNIKDIVHEAFFTNNTIKRKLFRIFFRIQWVRLKIRKNLRFKAGYQKKIDKDLLTLEKKGFLVKKEMIDISEINKDLEKAVFIEQGTNKQIKGVSKVLKQKKIGSGIYKLMNPHETISSINKLGHNKGINKISKGYLGPKSRIAASCCWISRKSDLIGPSHHEVNFHYDIDSWMWLKVFIYLSNTTSKNGPHRAITSTHTHKHFFSFIERRLSINRVKKLYPGKIQTFIGDKGTVIFEDTSNYHAASYIEEGYRIMLHFSYSAEENLQIN